MSEPPSPPLLEIRKATKRFPGVLALAGVDLTLDRGEVLAVVGENGAGKTTLMNILAGVHSLDAGEIRLEGRPVAIGSVPAAMALGIALIHQELNLCDNLDVAANVFLGREPRIAGILHRARMANDCRRVLATIGLDASPQAVVSSLPIGKQQMVEIAKALSMQARILIMDEPTSSLSRRETDVLFRVVRGLRDRGVSILYISHRLGEVDAIADRVLVLRDGRNAGWLPRAEIDREQIVQLMVGRDLPPFARRGVRRPGATLLAVDHLVTSAHPSHRLNFAVRAGEIVGIAGLVGAGRTELLRTLFGVERPLAGTIRVAGRPVRFRGPADAIRAGLALVPEDRKQLGLILKMCVRENISLPGLWRNRRPGGFVHRAVERREAARMIAALNIKTSRLQQDARFLSGGNQQKVVLGKWLALEPRVLLLDEPTRGVDVGAKHEIYHLMEQLVEKGMAILFASSEMEEIVGMADRVLVMHDGRIAGQLAAGKLSEEAVMRLATGGRAESEGPDEPQQPTWPAPGRVGKTTHEPQDSRPPSP